MKDDKWARNRGDFPENPRRGVELGENDEFAEFDGYDETTRRIRNAFEATRASLPSDFFESRLKKALDESPAWERFAQNGAAASVAVRPGVLREKRSETRRGRRGAWLGAGSAAAVAIGAALFVGWDGGAEPSGENGNLAKVEQNAAPLAESENPANENVPATENFVVRIPLNEGESAVAAPRRSEDDFWATFPVAKNDLRTFGGNFTRFCLKRGINVDKFDGDAEFLLKNVTPENGREIAAWFRAQAEKKAAKPSAESVESGDEKTPGWRASKAVERWLKTTANDDGEARDVRVSFVAPETAKVDGE